VLQNIAIQVIGVIAVDLHGQLGLIDNNMFIRKIDRGEVQVASQVDTSALVFDQPDFATSLSLILHGLQPRQEVLRVTDGVRESDEGARNHGQNALQHRVGRETVDSIENDVDELFPPSKDIGIRRK